eukprot:6185221-Pleurochrysis_carterae.AAC.1
MTKEEGKVAWDEKTAHKVRKYVDGIFAKNGTIIALSPLRLLHSCKSDYASVIVAGCGAVLHANLESDVDEMQDKHS